MLDQVMAAFERQDYQAAAQLLRELLKQSPDDPWVKLYLGRLQEVSGKPKVAEEIYRQLLRNQTSAKLVSQARQGLQRLGALAKSQPATPAKTAAIAPNLAANQDIGFMVLEPIAAAARTEIAKRFAQLLNTDLYTARGILPSRGWRLYRVSAIDELNAYGQELQQAGVPAFWTSLAEIHSLQVFQVSYFQLFQPKASIVCQNQANQTGTLTFDWAEVSQRVEGLLPLFSQVVDLGYRDRLEWKEHIEDYAHFCDLHLPERRCILRIHDGKYSFRQGITANSQRDTTRQHWNELMVLLSQHLPSSVVWSDFTQFAETTGDFMAPLQRLKSHIYLSRASDCQLDSAFHLFSCLAYFKALADGRSVPK